ncbi:ABC transporter permease [Acidothermaceae bacterium B102]|nr:ABC transporter permease [Acidothermaceae bacterium B102]
MSTELDPAGRSPSPSTAPAPTRANTRYPTPSWGKRLLSVQEFGVASALVFLVVVIGAFHPTFLHHDVLLGTLQTASFVAIIAYGMVFLLAMSEIDLSVGGTYAFSIILSAKLMAQSGLNPWISALVGIAAAALLGAFNGVAASLLHLPVIIVTLGTLSLYSGIVTIVSNAQPVAGLPLQSSFFTTLGGDQLGVPTAAWVAIVLLVVLSFVFTKTRFGAMVRAVGSNPHAAAFSGISIGRTRLYAVALTGGLAGVAGALSLAYFQGADPTIGVGLELQVIAAAIIGGTAVTGGRGTVPGALIGALIVAVINGGLVYFEVPTTWTDFVTGAVILAAVGADSLLRRRRVVRATRTA